MQPPKNLSSWRDKKWWFITGATFLGLLLVLGGLAVYHGRSRQSANCAEKRPQPTTRPPSAKPEADIEVAVPAAFGGKIHSKSLARLLDATYKHDMNHEHLRVILEGRGGNCASTFAMGEPFMVRISAPRDCYYAVIHHNSDGTFQLILPGSEPDGSEKLKKGVIQELRVHTIPPGGHQEFMLICVEKPIQLEQVLSGPPESYRRALSVAVAPYAAPDN